jgi:mRNA interferase MazF
MTKDFDAWNEVKKTVDRKIIGRDLYFHEREVWWCSLGLNVGVEYDGKNADFERPVLVVKKFNANMVWILPLTGIPHDNRYYRKIKHGSDESWACLTQIRTVSTKRLLRKVSKIGKTDFEEVLQGIVGYIEKRNPR